MNGIQKAVSGEVENAIRAAAKTYEDLGAELVEEVSGQRVSPIYNSGQESGISHAVADISLARDLLGYTPRVRLADGLRRMLEEDERFRRRA